MVESEDREKWVETSAGAGEVESVRKESSQLSLSPLERLDWTGNLNHTPDKTALKVGAFKNPQRRCDTLVCIAFAAFLSYLKTFRVVFL